MKRNGRTKGQKRTSRQHERLQARAGRDSEAPRGEHHYWSCSRKLAGPLVCGGLSQESVQFLKIDRLGEIGVKSFCRCTPLVGVLTIAAYRDYIYAGQSGFFPQHSSDRIAV